MVESQTLHTESTVTHEPATQTMPVLTPSTWTLKINVFAILGIIGAAFLTGIISMAFAAGGTLNTDHFLLSTTAKAVTEIQSSQQLYVRSDVYNANQTAILSNLQDIKSSIDALNTAVNTKK